MPLRREPTGVWSVVIETAADRTAVEGAHPSYLEAFPRYLTCFDTAFTRAKARSEFSFLWTLLGIRRGLQDAGWNPYETSIDAIEVMSSLQARAKTESFYATRHIQLWLFGHIIEASEPYEILANLIAVSRGESFLVTRFPDQNGRPQSPGSKIDQLERAAIALGMPDVAIPMREVWDRDLRNAIFHSDYSLSGGEVRFKKSGRHTKYDDDQVVILVNRALAYFAALKQLRAIHIASYKEPKEIDVHPEMGGPPGERAIVMVREGYGAIGLKHAWTVEQLRAGHIPWLVAHWSEEERRMSAADPTRAFFPARERSEQEGANTNVTS